MPYVIGEGEVLLGEQPDRTALDDFDDAMNFNLFEAGAVDKQVFVKFGTRQLFYNAIEVDAWSREEKDGRLVPDNPMQSASVVLRKSELEADGVTVDDYKSLLVTFHGVVYGVMSYSLSHYVRLFLKAGANPTEQPDEHDDPYDPPVEEPEEPYVEPEE